MEVPYFLLGDGVNLAVEAGPPDHPGKFTAFSLRAIIN